MGAAKEHRKATGGGKEQTISKQDHEHNPHWDRGARGGGALVGKLYLRMWTHRNKGKGGGEFSTKWEEDFWDVGLARKRKKGGKRRKGGAGEIEKEGARRQDTHGRRWFY